MIALSETAIKSTMLFIIFRTMNYRDKKRGGGVSSTVLYKTRKDIQIDGDVNSVFIEIPKTSFNTKCNVICGCVYRPPFMSLKSCNVQLNAMLGNYNMKRNMSYNQRFKCQYVTPHQQ